MTQLEADIVDEQCLEATEQYRAKLYADFGMDKAKKEDAIELEAALSWQIDGFDDGYIKAAESVLIWNSASRPPATGTVCFLAAEEPETKVIAVIRAKYSDGTDLEIAKGHEDKGNFDKKKKVHFCPAGWYEWNVHDKVHWGITYTPRFWMEIPPVPSVKFTEAKAQTLAMDMPD